jgi:E3 ubiquitin-protein ligase TRIP12
MDSIKADHGYNLDSKSVRNLLATMSEFDAQQRRDFLQFITGSPKLPIGGMSHPTILLYSPPAMHVLTTDQASRL